MRTLNFAFKYIIFDLVSTSRENKLERNSECLIYEF